MVDVDPLSVEWTAAQVEVMHRLRDWAVGFTELNQHLAAWMRLPGSDANALGQIVWADEAGAPLSPHGAVPAHRHDHGRDDRAAEPPRDRGPRSPQPRERRPPHG